MTPGKTRTHLVWDWNGTVFGDRLSGRARKKLWALHEERAENYPDDWPVSPIVAAE